MNLWWKLHQWLTLQGRLVKSSNHWAMAVHMYRELLCHFTLLTLTDDKISCKPLELHVLKLCWKCLLLEWGASDKIAEVHSFNSSQRLRRFYFHAHVKQFTNFLSRAWSLNSSTTFLNKVTVNKPCSLSSYTNLQNKMKQKEFKWTRLKQIHKYV